VLGFKERMRIALGAAQGLAYLHQGAPHTVVLRDFKTPNVLVDKVCPRAMLRILGSTRPLPLPLPQPFACLR